MQEMGKNNERPIIFPMSNPTIRMECTAEDAQKYTGKLLVARFHSNFVCRSLPRVLCRHG